MGDDKGLLLHQCEQHQLRLRMLEEVVDSLRADRDKIFQTAMSEGVSIHALSRLVGLSRQSIMRIRDLDTSEPYMLSDGTLGTLEQELFFYGDGENYDEP